MPETISVVDHPAPKTKPPNRLSQELLPALRPYCQSPMLIIVYIVLGVVLLALGLPILIQSLNYGEVLIDYTSMGSTPQKTETFKITKTIKKPVIIQYQLDGFMQNNRRILTSVDWSQLAGSTLTESEIKSCDPRIGEGGTVLVKNPCGLLADLRFNDTFSFSKVDSGVSSPITYSTNGINWGSDKSMFKPQAGNAYDITDPQFINWMRPAALPNFRKTYGVFPNGLTAGTYEVEINNNYHPAGSFGRTLVLTYKAWFGAKNVALGLIMVISAAVLVLFAIFVAIDTFLIKHDSTQYVSYVYFDETDKKD
ncbi:putative ALA-interacting subunit 5 [Blattamonas nauphoetae]|uniref:ALA-interacting subunit 5 n=1 Tax=Blattamonas nauphoetae TaxID=2049346 RepID=A0ABQ9XM13_9EUKA|nr:putative ALA-interacting subunit 5 [Blattamonas nauphoetae]